VPFSHHSGDGISSESGLNDMTLGVKWNFLNIDKAAFAFKPFLALPTGDNNKGFGAGGVGFGAIAVASLELDKRLTVDGNLSLKRQATDGDSYNEFGISVAGKFEATKELTLVGELATVKDDTSGSKWETSLTAGAIYAVQKNIDIDLGLRFGLTNDTEATQDFGVLAGVTLKF